MQPEHQNNQPDEAIPRVRWAGKPPINWQVRSGLLTVAGAIAAVFAIAFWLNPYDADGNPRRMATHTQLGMPPCNFVLLTGKPCPACGMTTSFALLVRGDVAASMRANWAGTVLAVLWALTLLWAVAGGIAGRMLWIPPGRGELILTTMVAIILAMMLARWAVLLLG